MYPVLVDLRDGTGFLRTTVRVLYEQVVSNIRLNLAREPANVMTVPVVREKTLLALQVVGITDELRIVLVEVAADHIPKTTSLLDQALNILQRVAQITTQTRIRFVYFPTEIIESGLVGRTPRGGEILPDRTIRPGVANRGLDLLSDTDLGAISEAIDLVKESVEPFRIRTKTRGFAAVRRRHIIGKS